MTSSHLVFSSVLVLSSALLMACGGGGTGETTSSTGSSTSGSGGASTSSGASTTGVGGAGGDGSSTSTSTSTSTSGSGSTSSASGVGGGTTCGGDPVAPDYAAACSGTPFFGDGTCTDGSCAAADPLTDRTFKEWRKQTLALSGLTAAELATRTPISKIELTSGPDSVRVGIEYVVVLDWVRSRQAESIDFGSFPLAMTPTDAEVTQAVKIAIEAAEWTGLGAITTVADQTKVKAAFDACACGMLLDICHFDFQNVTGLLTERAFKELDAANNKCLSAKVDVGKGALLSCDPVPCTIN